MDLLRSEAETIPNSVVMMSNQSSQVIKSRFEIERDSQISWLAYEIDGAGWISLCTQKLPRR